MQNIRKKNEQEILTECVYHTKAGDEVLLLEYPKIAQTGIVRHCFTTRVGGVSKGMYSSMNLSFTRGDDEEAVRENYSRISEIMGVPVSHFVSTDQTHTTSVRKVTKEDAGSGFTKERGYKDVDGLITDVAGMMLSTFYADCVPLYFVDPVHRAIGLSHSGWKGTVGRMGKATIEAMAHAYGSKAPDIICAVGPSICQDCYEISEDVAEVFKKEFSGRETEILYGAGHGKYQLNLWKANEIVLMDAGIRKEHIAVTNICTCCNPQILFSHRASQGKRGNLGAFLCLI